MNLTDLLGVVHEAINASVARAIAKTPRPQLFPATVVEHDQAAGIATVTLDGGSEPTGAQVISNDVVTIGVRVMVLVMPPHGAFIVGKPRNGFGEWTAVSLLGGWTNLAGWPGFGFRTDGETVEFKGFVADGPAGTVAFNLPVGARPNDRVLLPTVSNISATTLEIQPDGDVIPGHGGAGVWVTTFGKSFPLDVV